MAQALFVLAAIGVTIYAVVDCFRSDDAEIRGMPKPLWLLVILLLPPVGGALWLILGRQSTFGTHNRRLRTIGPDDDPDFLRSLAPPRPRPRDKDRRRTEGRGEGKGKDDDDPQKPK
jgi:hypothetical protein